MIDLHLFLYRLIETWNKNIIEEFHSKKKQILTFDDRSEGNDNDDDSTEWDI